MSVNHWTDLQLEAVARRVAENMTANPNLQLPKALIEAQAVYVPKLERISEATCHQYGNHHVRLREALEAKGVVYPNRAAKQAQGTVETLKRAEFIRKFGDFIAVKPRQSPVVQSPEPDIQRLHTLEPEPEYVEPVVKRVTPDLIQVPSLKFVIIGFEPDKARDVERRARKHEVLLHAEFRFWKDENPRRLDNWLKWADAALLMTRWAGHDSQRKFQHHPVHEFVNGSVSAVVTKLVEVADRLKTNRAV